MVGILLMLEGILVLLFDYRLVDYLLLVVHLGILMLLVGILWFDSGLLGTLYFM